MLPRPPLPVLVLTPVLLAAPLAAQVAYFGDACEGGSGAKPSLAIEGLPVAGEAIAVAVGGPALSAGLVIGGEGVFDPGLPLDDVQLPGCELLVDPVVLVPFALDADGAVSIPLVTWGAGATVRVQAFVHDPGAATLGGLSRGASVTSLAAGGAIVISEIMKDPDFVPDSAGEWVELHNRTDADVDVEGWTLRDEGGELAVLDAGGAGVVVPAGGYVTLGNGADPLLNGGIEHAAVLTGFVLSNGADQVILEDAEGVLVDRVDYLDGAGWPDEIGAALALDADFLHGYYSGLAEHWSAAECELGGVPYDPDRGTPGQANDECSVSPPAPPTGELILSEVMQNPKEVFDELGEWFELHNTTPEDVDLLGWTLVAGGIEVIDAPVIVPAGGYALFARNADPAVNGGLPAPDHVLGPGMFLGNGSEHLRLYDTASALVCELAYDNGATFPDPVGRSMTLDPEALDVASSLEGANWCEGSSVYGDGDRGTPGAPNDGCP